MNLKITPEAIGHDLNELDRQIAQLQHKKATLRALLDAQNTTPTGRKKRLSGNKGHYKEAIYNALHAHAGKPISDIAADANVSVAATTRLLKELRAEGKAKEITGQKKYTRWVRTEIRIKPGEEV